LIWPERFLSGLAHSPTGDIEVHTTGIPPGASNGWVKVEMFDGIYTILSCQTDRPRILCGDLNTPQVEFTDGQVCTWGQKIIAPNCIRTLKTRRDSHGRVDTGERWDQAERNVLVGLAEFDLADVFRSLHGYGVQEWSWYWRAGSRRIGRRFDHVFASACLNAINCHYLHDLREMGLSDHSGIEVDFAFGAQSNR
jgi:exonuclease III